jgi:transposase
LATTQRVSAAARVQRRRAKPDWAAIHRELKRKHVKLSILWEKYLAGEPGSSPSALHIISN